MGRKLGSKNVKKTDEEVKGQSSNDEVCLCLFRFNRVILTVLTTTQQDKCLILMSCWTNIAT